MTDQKPETATADDGLFMEELAQIRGGQLPAGKLDLRPFTLPTNRAETGTEPPVFPGGDPKPKPLTTGLLEHLPFPLPRF